MGRGYNGRGRGGGRGSARGQGFRAFSGAGQTLGGAVLDDSTYYSRGFGASKPGRGGSLSAKGQNAVPFDYSRLNQSAASSSSTPDSGISRPSSSAGQHPSQSQNSNRTPIVPAGRSPFAKGRYVREPEYPAFVTSRGNAMDGGSRAPEAQGDAKYMAAIPGRSSAGAGGGKFRKAPRFGDPADRNPHLMPVSFIQASGEWKDGKWTGRDVSKDDDGHAVEGSQSRFDAINSRRAGAGLGFANSQPSSNVQTTTGDWSAPDTEGENGKEASVEDQMAALLQAFPGSEELQGESMLDFEAPRMEFEPTRSSAKGPSGIGAGVDSAESASAMESSEAEVVGIPAQSSDAGTHIAAAAPLSAPSQSLPQRPASPSSDDGEEMILVGNQTATEANDTHLTAQSDSEEERQLNAIIAAAANASPKASTKQDSHSPPPASQGFTFDFTGDSSPAKAIDTIATPGTGFVLGDEREEWEEALPEHGDASAPPRKDLNDLDPRAGFSHMMTDSSEDEFVPLSGKSGAHGKPKPSTNRKARIAAKKARRKARKSGGGIVGQDDDDDDDDMGGRPPQQRKEARVGDSDLEWGSDGPPDVSKSSRTRRQEAKHPQANTSAEIDLRGLSLGGTSRGSGAGHDLPRTRADEERMLQEALALSAGGDGSGGQARSGVQYSSISVRAPPQSKRGLSQRQLDQEAILADYMEHALQRPQSDDDDSEGEGGDFVKGLKEEQTEEAKASEMDAMLKFMQGMDGQQGGRPMTLGDIEDEMKMGEEDEWMTESGEDDDDEDGSASDNDETAMEAALDVSERQEIGESGASSMDSGDSDEEDEEDEIDIDDDDDEDEDDGDDDDDDDASEEEDGRIFDRNFSWAAEDEAFIDNIERFARANDDVLRGNDRAARNKLFKAIEQGDFADMEGAPAGDLADLLDDDDLVGTQPAKKSKKGKGKQRWQNDAIWADKLQLQWEKDRATKADNKRKRAEERRAAAMNPFASGSVKKGTKKMAKKAARAARRQAGSGVRTDDEDADEWDPEAVRGGRSACLLMGLGTATNLRELDTQILSFLDNDGQTTMSLPPMEKRSRAQVHMLADAYSLKSKSRGSGRARFITLFKNKHSGVQVDTRKVARIISGRGDASFGVTVKGGKKTAKGGASGGGKAGGQAGSFVASNRDGAEVGFGADKIGADNIGHRLLSAMGWSEGMGVGASGIGMADPVNATIKTSKGGLGF